MVERKFPKLKAGGSSPFSLETYILYGEYKKYTPFPNVKIIYQIEYRLYVCLGIGGIERPTSRLSGVRSYH